MKKLIAVILLASLVVIPLIKTKINNAGSSKKHSLSLELAHEKGMSKENYRDIYLLGLYLWSDSEFLKSLETELKENGIEEPHETIDDIEIVGYLKKGIIELNFEDTNPDQEIKIVIVHAFSNEMSRRSIEGIMHAFERRAAQLEAMNEELDQLPADDWRRYQLSRAIDAVSFTQSSAKIRNRPAWNVQY